jgi:hypothetical protein
LQYLALIPSALPTLKDPLARTATRPAVLRGLLAVWHLRKNHFPHAGEGNGMRDDP